MSENTAVYQAPQSDVTTSEPTQQPKFLAMSGRIGRVRYLMYSSLMGIILFALLAVVAFATTNLAVLGVAGAVIAIASLVYAFALMVRRLNDLGKSGWLSLLLLVPLANLGLILYALFGRGDEQSNQYGAAPSANSTTDVVMAILMPVVMIIVSGAGQIYFAARMMEVAQ